MNTADLIYQESQVLPENLRTEVLDFIGYLKARYVIPAETIVEDKKVAELKVAFAPFRTSLESFKFDREEANER